MCRGWACWYHALGGQKRASNPLEVVVSSSGKVLGKKLWSFARIGSTFIH